MPSTNDLVNLARAAAERAGAYLRNARPTGPAGWTAKGTADWVTEVDQTAEAMIGEVLLGGAPGSSIVGEELSPALVQDELVWIVDPLDGTTNFLHGFPAWAVSIAAAVHGVLEAAVIYHVPADRLAHASRGAGAWEGERPLRVSTIREPAHALIGTGFPFKDHTQLDSYLRQFARVAASTSGIRRPGSAAIDLMEVAAGSFDGFWEQHLSAWDVAAGTLLIREAGGRVTDLSGRDLQVGHGSVVAGNPVIHEWLLRVLSSGY
jgi:myo-inositol-1(or 4)-monophosphatase